MSTLVIAEHDNSSLKGATLNTVAAAQAMGADRSRQHIVNQAAVRRLVADLSSNSTHMGAYCRVRQRLPQTMASSLTQYPGFIMDQQVGRDPACES